MTIRAKHLLEIQCLRARLEYLETLERLRTYTPKPEWQEIESYHDKYHKPSDFTQDIKSIYGKDFQ
jgi:hypothetical protein